MLLLPWWILLNCGVLCLRIKTSAFFKSPVWIKWKSAGVWEPGLLVIWQCHSLLFTSFTLVLSGAAQGQAARRAARSPVQTRLCLCLCLQPCTHHSFTQISMCDKDSNAGRPLSLHSHDNKDMNTRARAWRGQVLSMKLMSRCLPRVLQGEQNKRKDIVTGDREACRPRRASLILSQLSTTQRLDSVFLKSSCSSSSTYQKHSESKVLLMAVPLVCGCVCDGWPLTRVVKHSELGMHDIIGYWLYNYQTSFFFLTALVWSFFLVCKSDRIVIRRENLDIVQPSASVFGLWTEPRLDQRLLGPHVEMFLCCKNRGKTAIWSEFKSFCCADDGTFSSQRCLEGLGIEEQSIMLWVKLLTNVLFIIWLFLNVSISVLVIFKYTTIVKYTNPNSITLLNFKFESAWAVKTGALVKWPYVYFSG